MRRLAVVAVLGLLSLGTMPASAVRPDMTAPPAPVITGQVWTQGANNNVIWIGTCLLVAVAQETVTGGQDTYTGLLAGAAVAYNVGTGLPEAPDVTCAVRINGGTVDQATDGPTPSLDIAAKQTWFTALDSDTVTLCITLGLGVGADECGPTTTQQVPPQEVVDLVTAIEGIVADLTAPFDSIVCGVLKFVGLPPAVDLLRPTLGMDWDDCDVYVASERLIDLSPYGDPPTG